MRQGVDDGASGLPPPVRSETQRVRRFYEKYAPRYDNGVRFCEWILRLEDGRRWVCSRAGGDVLEVGIGTGLNLPHYAADVRLTGIDLSPAMLNLARRRAADLGRTVDLRLGDAHALPFSDDEYDCVVITLALCSIPDDRRAIAEAHRVLRPGGKLLALEHVRSPARVVQAVQRILDPLFVKFQADHLLREPLDHLRALGFAVESVHRSVWGIVERVAARKPA